MNPRYPRGVCSACQNTGMFDKDGNPIDFFNIDAGGGFMSITVVNDKKVRGENHQCFIRGHECRAEEGRFGGIVVQLVATTTGARD